MLLVCYLPAPVILPDMLFADECIFAWFACWLLSSSLPTCLYKLAWCFSYVLGLHCTAAPLKLYHVHVTEPCILVEFCDVLHMNCGVDGNVLSVSEINGDLYASTVHGLALGKNWSKHFKWCSLLHLLRYTFTSYFSPTPIWIWVHVHACLLALSFSNANWRPCGNVLKAEGTLWLLTDVIFSGFIL